MRAALRRVALLAALGAAAGACSFEFDRVWIAQPDGGALAALPAPRAAAPLPDAGPRDAQYPSGTLSCAEVEECFTTCADEDDPCFYDCYYRGTPAAQDQSAALGDCFEAALAGACQDPCLQLQSEPCYACLDDACAAPLDACFRP